MSIEQLDTEGEDFVRVMTEFLEWCGMITGSVRGARWI